MENDFVKIRRDILNWEWWDKPDMVILLVYVLASANVEKQEWQGKEILRGQFVTSLNKVCRDNPKIGKQVIRTCLKRLEKEGIIKIDTSFGNSIITICNYDEIYRFVQSQNKEDTTTPQVKETKTQNKPQKTKNEIQENTERRAKRFYEELIPYLETYDKKMLRDFYDYWSEPNKSGSQMRFEQERTWDLSRRLARWSRGQNEYKKNGDNQQTDKSKRRGTEVSAASAEDYKGTF